MWLNLKLTHKGFLLVTVPLIFELVLLGTLAWLLEQAESEAKQLDHSRAIIWQLDLLGNTFLSSGASLMAYNSTGQDLFVKRYEEGCQQLTGQLRTLYFLTSKDEHQTQSVKRINVLMNRVIRMMQQARSMIDKKESLATYEILNVGFELNHAFAELSAESQKILVTEQDIAGKASPEASERFRLLLKRAILIGVVLSILLAVALAMFFNQGTVARLKVLLDNTVRLSRREKLNPQVAGADELAHLDESFHRMAAALAEAIRKEQAAIENALDVICSLDPTGNFVAVNPACVKVWGYRPEEVIGRNYLELVAPDDQKLAESELQQLIQGAERAPFENRLQRKDGQLVDMLWSAHWSEQEQTLFCVAHNVTERKELERLKQQFMNMVTHDLRSPLTSIQCAMAMLADGLCGELPESAQRKVATVERNVNWLIDLIGDLLEIDRLEAGKMELQIDDHSVSSIFERATAAVEDSASKQQINLKVLETEVVVHADADRLVQVLVNLISNAIKFSPKNSTISVSASEKPGAVEMRVTDQGRGIPAKYKERIFERFQQVSVSDATKKGGTGLGLAICKAIVDAHGGTIGVESEEGAGTTIWFRIPAGISQADGL